MNPDHRTYSFATEEMVFFGTVEQISWQMLIHEELQHGLKEPTSKFYTLARYGAKTMPQIFQRYIQSLPRERKHEIVVELINKLDSSLTGSTAATLGKLKETELEVLHAIFNCPGTTVDVQEVASRCKQWLLEG